MLSTMTVVLVHGNPETDAIWGPLVDALGRDDVVRLSPPGFGAPLPDPAVGILSMVFCLSHRLPVELRCLEDRPRRGAQTRR